GSNIIDILSTKSGSGTARDLRVGTTGSGASLTFRTDNTNRWQVAGSTGHLLTILDNTYDIGASGASRPRTGHFGTSVVVGATVITSNKITFGSLGTIENQADGVTLLRDNAGTDFSRLQFGGTTSSFGGIARDGAG